MNARTERSKRTLPCHPLQPRKAEVVRHEGVHDPNPDEHDSAPVEERSEGWVVRRLRSLHRDTLEETLPPDMLEILQTAGKGG
jgi:hypothetical protein